MLADSGISLLAEGRRRAQAAFAPHEALVERVAREMQRAGRIVWRGLRLRAPLLQPDATTRWAVAMPDVFSVRHTTVEAYLEPIVHEIKVRRADLLSDLRHPDKSAAYQALCGQCWYVLKHDIAQADEVPLQFGVMFADERGMTVARPAPRRAVGLPFSSWMALARADAEPDTDALWQDDLINAAPLCEDVGQPPEPLPGSEHERPND